MKREINIIVKPLSEFSLGDTIYVSKKESGFTKTYFCRFTSFYRGVVKAEVLLASDYAKHEVGESITTRPSNCYLWGETNSHNEIMGYPSPHCNWFKKKNGMWVVW